MKIPPEFPELCINFDPQILDAYPEVTDEFGFALKHINAEQRQVVKHFILDVLENVHNPDELDRIWRAGGSNSFFDSDDGLRWFLGEIVRRIDLFDEGEEIDA